MVAKAHMNALQMQLEKALVPKLGANFLILSNGDNHLVYGIDTKEKQLLVMEHFPKHS